MDSWNFLKEIVAYMEGEDRLVHDDYRRSLDHTDPDNPGRAIAIVMEVVHDIYWMYYGQKVSWQLMRLTSGLLGPPATPLQATPLIWKDSSGS